MHMKHANVITADDSQVLDPDGVNDVQISPAIIAALANIDCDILNFLAALPAAELKTAVQFASVARTAEPEANTAEREAEQDSKTAEQKAKTIEPEAETAVSIAIASIKLLKQTLNCEWCSEVRRAIAELEDATEPLARRAAQAQELIQHVQDTCPPKAKKKVMIVNKNVRDALMFECAVQCANLSGDEARNHFLGEIEKAYNGRLDCSARSQLLLAHKKHYKGSVFRSANDKKPGLWPQRRGWKKQSKKTLKSILQGFPIPEGDLDSTSVEKVQNHLYPEGWYDGFAEEEEVGWWMSWMPTCYFDPLVGIESLAIYNFCNLE